MEWEEIRVEQCRDAADAKDLKAPFCPLLRSIRPDKRHDQSGTNLAGNGVLKASRVLKNNHTSG